MWFCINYSIRHFAAIIFPSSIQPKHFWILFTKLPFSIAIRSDLLQRKRKHMLAMYIQHVHNKTPSNLLNGSFMGFVQSITQYPVFRHLKAQMDFQLLHNTTTTNTIKQQHQKREPEREEKKHWKNKNTVHLLAGFFLPRVFN